MQPVQSQVIEGLWRRSHKRSEQTQGAQYPSDDRGSCAFLDGLNHHTRLGKMCSWVAHHHRERQDCTYHRRSTYAVDRPRVEQFAVNHQRARSTQQSAKRGNESSRSLRRKHLHRDQRSQATPLPKHSTIAVTCWYCSQRSAKASHFKKHPQRRAHCIQTNWKEARRRSGQKFSSPKQRVSCFKTRRSRLPGLENISKIINTMDIQTSAAHALTTRMRKNAKTTSPGGGGGGAAVHKNSWES